VSHPVFHLPRLGHDLACPFSASLTRHSTASALSNGERAALRSVRQEAKEALLKGPSGESIQDQGIGTVID
jgi:hypothetical protein